MGNQLQKQQKRTKLAFFHIPLFLFTKSTWCNKENIMNGNNLLLPVISFLFPKHCQANNTTGRRAKSACCSLDHAGCPTTTLRCRRWHLDLNYRKDRLQKRLICILQIVFTLDLFKKNDFPGATGSLASSAPRLCGDGNTQLHNFCFIGPVTTNRLTDHVHLPQLFSFLQAFCSICRSNQLLLVLNSPQTVNYTSMSNIGTQACSHFK